MQICSLLKCFDVANFKPKQRDPSLLTSQLWVSGSMRKVAVVLGIIIPLVQLQEVARYRKEPQGIGVNCKDTLGRLETQSSLMQLHLQAHGTGQFGFALFFKIQQKLWFPGSNYNHLNTQLLFLFFRCACVGFLPIRTQLSQRKLPELTLSSSLQRIKLFSLRSRNAISRT